MFTLRRAFSAMSTPSRHADDALSEGFDGEGRDFRWFRDGARRRDFPGITMLSSRAPLGHLRALGHALTAYSFSLYAMTRRLARARFGLSGQRLANFDAPQLSTLYLKMRARFASLAFHNAKNGDIARLLTWAS